MEPAKSAEYVQVTKRGSGSTVRTLEKVGSNMKITGVLIAFMLLTGMAHSQDGRNAPTQLSAESMHFGWADVLRVDPVYAEVATTVPQQECYEEQVEPPPPPAADVDSAKRTGATLLGAIIGGIVGNRFGKGDGRKATTAAGVIAGGVVGNNLAATDDDDRANADGRYPTRRRCRAIDNNVTQRQIVAYDVEYRYRGEIYSSRLNHDPGDRMRVRVSVIPAD